MAKREERTGIERRGRRALFIGASVLAGMLILMAMPAPVAAKGPPVRITFPLPPLGVVNVCTGNPAISTGFLTLIIHEFELTDPDRHHFNIQFIFELTDTEGFSGRAVGPDIDNGAGLFVDPEGRGVFTSIFNLNVRNPDTHQRIIFSMHLHLTLVDGDFKAIVDAISDRCVGKP